MAMLANRHASSLPIAERLEAADVAAALLLARDKDSPAIEALASASEIGCWQSLLALSAATWACGRLLGDARMASAGRRMLVAGALASAVKTTTKRSLHRTRPNVMMDTGLYARGLGGTRYGPWQSFPSGHSALSVAVARALGRAYPGLRPAAYAGAAGIALAQVLRGAHFPTDVLAGSLIGFAAEAAAQGLAERRARAASGDDGTMSGGAVERRRPREPPPHLDWGNASSNTTASPRDGPTSAPCHITVRPRRIVPTGQPVTVTPS